jgi:hypothetical protein
MLFAVVFSFVLMMSHTCVESTIKASSHQLEKSKQHHSLIDSNNARLQVNLILIIFILKSGDF